MRTETQSALADINSIAAVEGLGDTQHPEVWKAIEESAKHIRKAGKVSSILVGEADVQRCFDMRFLFVAVGSDIGILACTADALAEKFRAS